MHKIVNGRIIHYQQCHNCEQYVLKTKDRLCATCHIKESRELINLPKPNHRVNDKKNFIRDFGVNESQVDF